MRVIHGRARAIILDRGLRFDRVAEKVGLTRDRFAHVLAGRRPVPEPSARFYADLAAALFCEPAQVREPTQVHEAEGDLQPAA